MGYCLRVNHKKLPTGRDPDRDRQFAYIGKLRARHERDGLPIVSVDTKKRELIGNFKNPGASWQREPVLVNDHDFPSIASGVAIPYGVYDVPANEGAVFIGAPVPDLDVHPLDHRSIHRRRRLEVQHAADSAHRV